MKKEKYAIYIGLPVFLIFAVSVMMKAGWIVQFDAALQHVARAIPNLTGLMLKLSLLAAPKVDLIWMLILAVILWFKHMQPMATSIVITLVSADAVGFIIKHIVQRARPVQHLAIDDGFSFPSGHTLGMGVIVFWLILVLLPIVVKDQTKLFWIDLILIIWLVIVMCSRVYVFAHYPSDVCASTAFAAFWVGLVAICLKKIVYQIWHKKI